MELWIGAPGAGAGIGYPAGGRCPATSLPGRGTESVSWADVQFPSGGLLGAERIVGGWGVADIV